MTHDHIIQYTPQRLLAYEGYEIAFIHSLLVPYPTTVPPAASSLQHRCSATAGHCVIDALVSVHDTPHFGFVQGYVKGREIYSSYISGEIEQFDVMVENHSLKA